ncbi:Uncharacterized protein APZ42_025242 [Daphnia magna]|uniref:Reverse transcriptase domain-containing protein n=1 Tax=Daphnia magna TaxID=35525 RepID=A0A164TBP2_9CRUS|nr:Uncharacterized protein APZ42_025242 [Daphnia magna]
MLSVMGMPAIEEEGPGKALSLANFTQSPILILEREFAASFNTQNFSWLYELPLQEISYPPTVAPEVPPPDPLHETQPFSPSQQNVRGCSQDSSEEQSQRGGDFVRLWVPAFLSCETILDLEGVLERCTADWLHKAQILEDPSPEKPRGNPNGRKRNHNGQMQKARRQIKLKAYEARKIQRLFNIYPRRAIREVLGDRSPSYNCTVEAAEEYLERTYHHLSLPPQQCQSARVLYDTCDWSHPSRDQMDFLKCAPSQKELEAKLRRATNTSPGVNGLEYRHLMTLDPDCILLETANFPSSDHLQTVLVSNQPETHRSHLRSWLVISRAKGIIIVLNTIPGVHGIQEHTQLLKTVVEETRTKCRHVSIAWLDMCNAFGSVHHAVLGELFASLPIPDDLRRILADIYSGNQMDFAAQKESVRIVTVCCIDGSQD